MPQGTSTDITAAVTAAAAAKKVQEEEEEAEMKVIKRAEVVPPQRLCLPIKLLDSIAFDRAKSWAKTNGEDYIALKADKEGILAL